MNKKVTRLTEQDLHRIIRETVNKVLSEQFVREGINEGFFSNIFGGNQQPSREEIQQQRIHDNYEKKLRSAFKKAAVSAVVHNSDPLYVNALLLAKKAYDTGIIEPYEFDDIFKECYITPRKNFLNHNTWLIQKGEKWPKPFNIAEVK